MEKNRILAAVICCEYKSYSLEQCLNAIKEAGFDCALNYEGKYRDANQIVLESIKKKI